MAKVNIPTELAGVADVSGRAGNTVFLVFTFKNEDQTPYVFPGQVEILIYQGSTVKKTLTSGNGFTLNTSTLTWEYDFDAAATSTYHFDLREKVLGKATTLLKGNLSGLFTNEDKSQDSNDSTTIVVQKRDVTLNITIQKLGSTEVYYEGDGHTHPDLALLNSITANSLLGTGQKAKLTDLPDVTSLNQSLNARATTESVTTLANLIAILQNKVEKYQGQFADLDAAEAAIPTPQAGWTFLNDETNTTWRYDDDPAGWVDTGGLNGVVQISDIEGLADALAALILKTDIYNGLDYTLAGKVADARALKTLKDLIDSLASSVTEALADKQDQLEYTPLPDSATINGKNFDENFELELDKTDIDLDQVDNTSDLNKPLSTAVIKSLRHRNNAFSQLRAQMKSGVSASILLLADSTSNNTSEWFYLFILALHDAYTTHSIKYYSWNFTSEQWDNPVFIHGSHTRYVDLTSATTGLRLSSSRISMPAGDIGLRALIRPTSITTQQWVMSKYGGSGNSSFMFGILGTGLLGFQWTPDGTSASLKYSQSTATLASVGITVNTDVGIRVDFKPNNGAGGYDVTFYYSTDGAATWMQLGNVVTGAGVTSIYASTYEWELGVRTFNVERFTGRIYHAEVRDGIGNGTPRVSPIAIDEWTPGNNTVVHQGNPVLHVYNGSHSGIGLTGLTDATRAAKMLIPHEFSAVIISCMHNDFQEPGMVYHEQYQTFLDLVRTKIKKSPIVLSTQNPKYTLVGNIATGVSEATRYDHAMRRGIVFNVARMNDCEVMDSYADFEDAGTTQTIIAQLMQGDGYHVTTGSGATTGSTLWKNVALEMFYGRY